MPLPLAQLVWERPEAAFLLLVPLVLLFVARRPGKAPVRPTGTLGLWRKVAESDRSTSSYRRRVPPFLWLASASLLSGITALCGPRIERDEEPATWKVVLDRSPSMGLPTSDAPAGETRLQHGVRLACRWLEDSAGPLDRVRWYSPGREELILAPGDSPPEAWLALDPVPLEEPSWERHDEPGCLWVSDVPPAEPREAALIATGAEPVSGPVASRGSKGGEELLLWSKTGELVSAKAPSVRRIVVPATGLPAVLERMLTSYGESRGLERATQASPKEVAFTFLSPGPNEVASVRGRVGRDGWQSQVAALSARVGKETSARDAPRTLSPWLSLRARGEEHVLVSFAPGFIECRLSAIGEPSGDPAAFAVSWSRLFDAVVLPFPGVVSLEERKTAGAARSLAGSGPPAPESASGAGRETGAGMLQKGRGPGSSLTSWLASLASLLAALAALVGFSRGRTKKP